MSSLTYLVDIFVTTDTDDEIEPDLPGPSANRSYLDVFVSTYTDAEPNFPGFPSTGGVHFVDETSDSRSESRSESDDEPRPSTSKHGNNDWKERDFFPKIHGFRGRTGVKHPGLDENSSPKQIMDCFVTEEIVEKTAMETNKYAESKRRDERPRRKVQPWRETSAAEIRVVFAMIVLMGIVSKPNLKSYWSTNRSTDTPYFAEVMARHRFLALLSYLHFVNKDEEDDNDRLKKIRPILYIVVSNCKSVFVPHRSISVDESLFNFRGRLGFKVYCQKKRARFGIKIYELCSSESRSAGYTPNFKVYTGQDKVGDDSASTRAVLDIIPDDLWDKG